MSFAGTKKVFKVRRSMVSQAVLNAMHVVAVQQAVKKEQAALRPTFERAPGYKVESQEFLTPKPPAP